MQACDIRVAGASARFGVSEARWGLFPLGGSAVRLTRQIPYTVAADLLLTGRHITAAEALSIGLIGHVVPDGQALISPFANPGLASGGTGDVLAGVITGLIAQGLDPFKAAGLGVYLHGLAGEQVAKELGSAGMLAGDLLPALPRVIARLRGEAAGQPPAAQTAPSLLDLLREPAQQE